MATRGFNRSTVILIAAVAAAGAGVIATAIAQWRGEHLTAVIALAAFAAVAERFDIRLPRSSSLSVSAAAILAAGGIAGLQGVMVVALTVALADHPGRNKPYYKAVFNAGALLVSGAAYVGVLEAVPVGNHGQEWPGLLVPVLLGVMVNFVVNSTLVALAIAASSGRRLLDVWQENFASLPPHYLMLGVLAAVIVSAYDLEGLLALVAALLPLAGMRFVMQQALARRAAAAASG